MLLASSVQVSQESVKHDPRNAHAHQQADPNTEQLGEDPSSVQKCHVQYQKWF